MVAVTLVSPLFRQLGALRPVKPGGWCNQNTNSHAKQNIFRVRLPVCALHMHPLSRDINRSPEISSPVVPWEGVRPCGEAAVPAFSHGHSLSVELALPHGALPG